MIYYYLFELVMEWSPGYRISEKSSDSTKKLKLNAEGIRNLFKQVEFNEAFASLAQAKLHSTEPLIDSDTLTKVFSRTLSNHEADVLTKLKHKRNRMMEKDRSQKSHFGRVASIIYQNIKDRRLDKDRNSFRSRTSEFNSDSSDEMSSDSSDSVSSAPDQYDYVYCISMELPRANICDMKDAQYINEDDARSFYLRAFKGEPVQTHGVSRAAWQLESEADAFVRAFKLLPRPDNCSTDCRPLWPVRGWLVNGSEEFDDKNDNGVLYFDEVEDDDVANLANGEDKKHSTNQATTAVRFHIGNDFAMSNQNEFMKVNLTKLNNSRSVDPFNQDQQAGENECFMDLVRVALTVKLVAHCGLEVKLIRDSERKRIFLLVTCDVEDLTREASSIGIPTELDNNIVDIEGQEPCDALFYSLHYKVENPRTSPFALQMHLALHKVIDVLSSDPQSSDSPWVSHMRASFLVKCGNGSINNNNLDLLHSTCPIVHAARRSEIMSKAYFEKHFRIPTSYTDFTNNNLSSHKSKPSSSSPSAVNSGEIHISESKRQMKERFSNISSASITPSRSRFNSEPFGAINRNKKDLDLVFDEEGAAHHSISFERTLRIASSVRRASNFKFNKKSPQPQGSVDKSNLTSTSPENVCWSSDLYDISTPVHLDQTITKQEKVLKKKPIHKEQNSKKTYQELPITESNFLSSALPQRRLRGTPIELWMDLVDRKLPENAVDMDERGEKSDRDGRGARNFKKHMENAQQKHQESNRVIVNRLSQRRKSSLPHYTDINCLHLQPSNNLIEFEASSSIEGIMKLNKGLVDKTVSHSKSTNRIVIADQPSHLMELNPLDSDSDSDLKNNVDKVHHLNNKDWNRAEGIGNNFISNRESNSAHIVDNFQTGYNGNNTSNKQLNVDHSMALAAQHENGSKQQMLTLPTIENSVNGKIFTNNNDENINNNLNNVLSNDHLFLNNFIHSHKDIDQNPNNKRNVNLVNLNNTYSTNNDNNLTKNPHRNKSMILNTNNILNTTLINPFNDKTIRQLPYQGVDVVNNVFDSNIMPHDSPSLSNVVVSIITGDAESENQENLSTCSSSEVHLGNYSLNFFDLPTHKSVSAPPISSSVPANPQPSLNCSRNNAATKLERAYSEERLRKRELLYALYLVRGRDCTADRCEFLPDSQAPVLESTAQQQRLSINNPAVEDSDDENAIDLDDNLIQFSTMLEKSSSHKTLKMRRGTIFGTMRGGTSRELSFRFGTSNSEALLALQIEKLRLAELEKESKAFLTYLIARVRRPWIDSDLLLKEHNDTVPSSYQLKSLWHRKGWKTAPPIHIRHSSAIPHVFWKIRESVTSKMDENDNPIVLKSPFTDAQRLELLHSLICKLVNIEVLQGESVLETLPLDSVAKNHPLIQKAFSLNPKDFIGGNSWKLPLDRIRNYWGDRIGLYFAFLGSFRRHLIAPAIIGTLMLTLELLFANQDMPVFDTDSDTYKINVIEQNITTCVLQIVFSYFIVIWTSIFVCCWRKEEAMCSQKWGSHSSIGFSSESEAVRPQFYGVPQRSPITGEDDDIYYPRRKRAVKVVVSFFILLIIAIISCVLVYFIAVLRTRWTIQATQSDENTWMAWASLITGVLGYIELEVMDLVSQFMCKVLTKWENWRTQSQHEDQLALKYAIMAIVIHFNSFVYVAVLKPILEGCVYKTGNQWEIFGPSAVVLPEENPNCLSELREQIVIYFIISIAKNLQELGIPLLHQTLVMRSVVRSWTENTLRVIKGQQNVGIQEQENILGPLFNSYKLNERHLAKKLEITVRVYRYLCLLLKQQIMLFQRKNELSNNSNFEQSCKAHNDCDQKLIDISESSHSFDSRAFTKPQTEKNDKDDSILIAININEMESHNNGDDGTFKLMNNNVFLRQLKPLHSHTFCNRGDHDEFDNLDHQLPKPLSILQSLQEEDNHVYANTVISPYSPPSALDCSDNNNIKRRNASFETIRKQNVDNNIINNHNNSSIIIKSVQEPSSPNNIKSDSKQPHKLKLPSGSSICMEAIPTSSRNFAHVSGVLPVVPRQSRLWAYLETIVSQLLALETYGDSDVSGSFEEYVEMTVLYAHLTLFASLFPIGFLIGLLLVVLEVRVDGYKIHRLVRRPLPQRASSIGRWLPIIEFFSLAAVVTNAVWLASILRVFEPFTKGDKNRISIECAFLFGIISIISKVLIHLLSNPKTKELRFATTRHQALVEKLRSRHEVRAQPNVTLKDIPTKEEDPLLNLNLRLPSFFGIHNSDVASVYASTLQSLNQERKKLKSKAIKLKESIKNTPELPQPTNGATSEK